MDNVHYSDDLPDLLVRCRSERGMLLADVAKALRLSVSGVSRIERRQIRPSRTTRLRIEAFLRKYGYFPKNQEAA